MIAEFYGTCAFEGFVYSHELEVPPFEQHQLHTHEMCEIHCVLRGKGSYVIEGTEHRVENGKIFLMRPGEFHKRGVGQKNIHDCLSIHFNPSIIDNLDPDRSLLDMFYNRPLGMKNVYSRHAVAGSGIYELFEKMDKYSGNDYIGKVNMKIFLVSVLFELKNLYISSLYDENSDKNNNIQQIIEYINSNLRGELSVGQLCDVFFLSRTQLNRKFKALTGSSVWEYIVAKRLMLAKQYISEGMGTVEAADMSGFGDYSSFYRAYIKRYNQKPSQGRGI